MLPKTIRGSKKYAGTKRNMIKGKYLFDSNIFIDFTSKEANIEYGYPVDNESKAKIIYIILYPFLKAIFAIYYLLHYYLIIRYLQYHKRFNSVVYLNTMNSLFKHLFGSNTITFEGEHDSNQIVIHSKNNFEFKYNLTEDYEKYCTSIELYGNTISRNWHGKEFNLSYGWFFVISFSQIPQVGTAEITYL